MTERFTFYTRVFGYRMNVADNDAIGARLSAHGSRHAGSSGLAYLEGRK
jgi:hypothetical protein